MDMLSRAHRLGHYGSFLRLFGADFLRRRLTNNRAVYETDFHGRRFRLRPCDSDADVLLQIFVHHEYDLTAFRKWDWIRSRYESYVRGGTTPLIVDVGANVGASAIYFHEMFPQAEIVSVEPDPANFDLLAFNVATIQNVRAIDAAIGATEGHVELAGGDHSWAVSTNRSAAGCPVITLDQIEKMYPDDRLFLVKVDIEGFEDDLFSDNLDWIDRADVIIIEPHDWLFPDRKSSRNFQKALGSRDFDLLIKGENLVYVRAN